LKKAKKYIPTVLAFVALFVVVRYESINITSNKWSAFDIIDMIVWYGLGLFIAIPTLIYSIKQLKKEKAKIFYLPIIIIGVGTFTIIGLLAYGNLTDNKSSIIFSAIYDGDTNGIQIDLREDKTYIINDYSVLGGEYFEGTFQVNRDTILLNKSKPLGESNDFITSKLIIRNDSLFFKTDMNGQYTNDYMRITNNKLKE
jgi:hypothetical protein